jgi:hypothetical protein
MMSVFRFTRLGIVTLLTALALTWTGPAQAQSCQFVAGFKALADQIPNVVGACTGNEYHDGQGNGFQNTTNGLMEWRRADNWTAFTNGHMTWVNGPNGVESRLNNQRFAWEANPAGLPHAGPPPVPNNYYDNRSTPQAVMLSLVNALNRKEYLRAYSYWEPNAQGLAPFPQFQAGYAQTATTQVNFGTIGGSVGAGQQFYTVPTHLVATTTSGEHQSFVLCYVLHLASPSAQGQPPFQGLRIRQAIGAPMSPGSDITRALNGVCAPPLPNDGPVPPPPGYAPGDISAGRYLDDRTDGVQVIRSLFNAVNRKEFVRAYSYWEPGATGLAPFPQFEQGYAGVQSVELTTGTQTSDVGAGQLVYSVPVIVRAQTTSGPQEFIGCYRLHLGSPSAQATPPFQPLAIRSGSLRQIQGFGLPQIDTLCQ